MAEGGPYEEQQPRDRIHYKLTFPERLTEKRSLGDNNIWYDPSSESLISQWRHLTYH